MSRAAFVIYNRIANEEAAYKLGDRLKADDWEVNVRYGDFERVILHDGPKVKAISWSGEAGLFTI